MTEATLSAAARRAATCVHCAASAGYRCAATGAPVCLAHARLAVVRPGALPPAAGAAVVRPATPAELPAVASLARHFWDETEVDCFGQTYDVLALPALAATADGAVVGCLVYAIAGDTMTVVMLNVLPSHQGRGAGSGLVRAAIATARERQLAAIRVATTNDDLPALALYQRHGFRLAGLLPGLVAEHHQKELAGFAGIPVRDELQLHLSIH